MKTSAILVELDSILDTRMATLHRLGGDAVEKALEAGYHERPFDFFPGVDQDAYDQLYAQRDKRTMASAMMTPVVQMVREFVAKTLDNVNNSPFHMQPKVIINIHPYKLSEGEIETLIRTFQSLTMEKADIEVIDKDYTELSALYVKVNLSVMVLYQYDKWLEAQTVAKSFEKHTAPDVTLIGPAIYFKKPEKKPSSDEDPFKAMCDLAAPFIGLVLVPVEKFSMVMKPVKKAAT